MQWGKNLNRVILIIISLFMLGLPGLTANAAKTSNIRVDYSCPGKVTVTYDLTTTQPTKVILWYSHNMQDWLLAETVTGDINGQSTGTNKTIVWDCYADNVHFGGFYFKLELPAPIPECVMINGLCWATRNVGAPGTFVDNPEDTGLYYQWNSSAGWSSTDPLVSTDGSSWDRNWDGYGATTWQQIQNPCPAGYRVPAIYELSRLVSSGSQWTTINDVDGRIFGSGDNVIFLPAAGLRSNDSSIYSVGVEGDYWSTTLLYGYRSANILRFRSNSVEAVTYMGVGISAGFSVRCVAE